MVAPQDAHRRRAAPDRGLVAQGGAFAMRRALEGHPRLGEAVVCALDDVPCDGGSRARREAIAIETTGRREIALWDRVDHAAWERDAIDFCWLF